jgi:Flp pilus assembly protein TadG
MHRPLTSSVRNFAADERGNVAVLFAFMSTIILLVAGIAIDYARTVNMNSRIGAAADAATLAAGRAMLDGKLNDEEVETLAKSYVRVNAESGTAMQGTYSEPVISLDRELGSVKVDVGVRVPTTLSRLSGRTEMNAPVSTAAVFEQKDVEVAMALDVTGSMTEYTSDRVRKIDALKKSFKLFVNNLLPEHMPDGRKVRIAVAPYSSGVNMGPFAKSASSNRSKDKCVIERTGGAVNTDRPVGSGAYFKVHEDQPKDTDNTEGRQDYACPDADIIPLTDDRDMLTRKVDDYRASGSTGGHLGLQWAWNLISEDWAGFWGGDSRPDPYSKTQGDKPELIKAVILMSDGVFNTSFFNGNSASQANSLCSNIKDKADKNVLVFSIAFGNPPPQAKRTLKECATEGAEYYADAASAAQLDAALAKFAGKLTQLRLAQ